MALGLIQDGGCGFREEPRKGEGEPCTRSSECELDLECRGGACRTPSFDAGAPGEDAGLDAAIDAQAPDASGDAAPPDAATALDAGDDAAIAPGDGSVDASGG